jgi:hypothetical protein
MLGVSDFKPAVPPSLMRKETNTENIRERNIDRLKLLDGYEKGHKSIYSANEESLQEERLSRIDKKLYYMLSPEASRGKRHGTETNVHLQSPLDLHKGSTDAYYSQPSFILNGYSGFSSVGDHDAILLS